MPTVQRTNGLGVLHELSSDGGHGERHGAGPWWRTLGWLDQPASMYKTVNEANNPCTLRSRECPNVVEPWWRQ